MAKKEKPVFMEQVVPTYLFNEEHGRMDGKLFTDKTECLEALASGEFWPCWTGSRKEVTEWALKKLGRRSIPKREAAKIISRPKDENITVINKHGNIESGPPIKGLKRDAGTEG